jgi:microcystin-dependent protein
MINGITGTTVSGDGIIGVSNGTVTYDNTNAAGTGVPFNANVSLTHKAKATGLNNIAASTGSYLSSVSFDEFGHVSAVAASQVIPAGVIVMWSGAVNAVPDGWVLCNGQNNTPDLRNRFVVGAGSTYAVDATGGSASTTLTTANLPAHSHSFSGTTGGGGSHSHTTSHGTGGLSNSGGHGVRSNAGAFRTDLNTSSVGNHTHSFAGTTSSVGSTSSFTNLPPYLALAYIMKT